MKTLLKIMATVATIIAVTNANAQDDFYPSKNKKSKEVSVQPVEEKINDSQYSTATDYYYEQEEVARQNQYNQEMGITDSTTYYQDENGNTRITNNYYSGDHYDYNNEYYDYEYSSRIRRFHRPYGRYGYYDNCYTNYYWYDYNPYNYGVSVYTSYNWWYPRPWGWNVGWSWGGWYTSWGWNTIGWGWSPYGWYGSSYWAGYNHGYHDGFYAGNYYNSYDRNSYYYGHRGNTSSGYAGYGRGDRPSNSSAAAITSSPRPVAPVKTFGEKYETAVRNNTLNTNGNIGTSVPRPMNNNAGNVGGVKESTIMGTQPSKNTNNNVGNSVPRPMSPSSTNPVYPRTTTDPNPSIATPKPRTPQPTNPNVGTPKPRTPQPTNPGVGNPRPRSYEPSTVPSNPPSYSQPRTPQGGSGTSTPKPRTYTQPTTKPSYNKPSQPSYSQPSNNSYSRPSGNSYNRGGGAAPSGGGGRRPR